MLQILDVSLLLIFTQRKAYTVQYICTHNDWIKLAVYVLIVRFHSNIYKIASHKYILAEVKYTKQGQRNA